MSNIRFSFPQLRRFAIAQNQFRGIIPNTLSNISGLDLLDLGENHLRGQVPDSLGMFKNLYWLRLDSKELGSGMLGDLNFLNSFNNISSLRVIGLYNNNFGGVLPNSIVNLSLQHFTLGNNRISGKNGKGKHFSIKIIISISITGVSCLAFLVASVLLYGRKRTLRRSIRFSLCGLY